ncbi:hypothetical protein DITRI_Ditri10aG0005700 [Diplodiscus trichospermus]
MQPTTRDAYGGGMYGNDQGQTKNPEKQPASETQSADGADKAKNKPNQITTDGSNKPKSEQACVGYNRLTFSFLALDWAGNLARGIVNLFDCPTLNRALSEGKRQLPHRKHIGYMVNADGVTEISLNMVNADGVTEISLNMVNADGVTEISLTDNCPTHHPFPIIGFGKFGFHDLEFQIFVLAVLFSTTVPSSHCYFSHEAFLLPVNLHPISSLF